MTDTPHAFADLVDLPALQEMLVSLHELAQVPVAIVDLEGKLLAAAGWRGICTSFHRPQPELEKICLASDSYLREEIKNGKSFASYQCPHGLVDSYAPIVVEGQHQANACIGQLLHTPLTDEQRLRLQEQAQKYGFNETDYLAALAELPVISAKRQQAILALLTRLGQQIALIGLNNRRAQEKANQLQAHAARNLEEAEAEKACIESQLRQAQKMEAIGTLAGGIAHDFNNILTAILGYTEMAITEVEKESAIANDLQEVLKAGNRAKNLVTQILAFSRQTAVEPIPIQLPSLLKEAIKLLRPSLPSTIAIKTMIEPSSALILADPAQIKQLLMNLCANAFQAMEKTGGRLEIGLRELHLGPEELSHEPEVKPGSFLRLTVRDTGPGIPAEIRDRIFDPYFTTKEMGKGTGLGLAIVHGLAKNYGGFVQLANAADGGATFHVYFPVYRQPGEESEENGSLLPTGQEAILLIDDEEVLTRLGKEMLEKLGYRVTVSNDSREALALFRQQPRQFDLVVTDQTMPGMTGDELARQLLHLRPDLPIILCTGHSSIVTAAEAQALGIREFAQKPLSNRELARLVRKAITS